MILVITPLPIELETLRACGLRDSSKMRLALGGHGKVQFALRTQALIFEHKPKLVVCAGACGSLSPDVRPMDVVVGERTIEHDFKLRFIQKPEPTFDGDGATVARLKKDFAIKAGDFAIHFGVIASGDEDVIDTERAKELRQQTMALCVAWEGAGGARACTLNSTPFVEIRGVTDFADSNASTNFKENLSLALRNVAAVLRTLEAGAAP